MLGHESDVNSPNFKADAICLMTAIGCFKQNSCNPGLNANFLFSINTDGVGGWSCSRLRRTLGTTGGAGGGVSGARIEQVAGHSVVLVRLKIGKVSEVFCKGQGNNSLHSLVKLLRYHLVVELNLVVVLHQLLNLDDRLCLDLVLVQQRLRHDGRRRFTFYRRRLDISLVVVHRVHVQRLVQFHFRVDRLLALELLENVLSECCCEIALRQKCLELLVTDICEDNSRLDNVIDKKREVKKCMKTSTDPARGDKCWNL